ncbi:VirB3 family type IV secretion system protein [Acidithiobacillus ferrivorans]|jgi:type IV secretion system protein VirB3|uniref:VirB3 family type IV secretion system protein n=1 Tax=Acidithiobacillus ferrivorans TaxID=160808 RepID=A0A7T4WCD6_9PROT|nr:VirB3 family type IV secretion system protein [Acidithiobacillus ferrivorans]QQD71970.1 VirB3 family type IV secretion system protein [Acidithiobacillus ferrivorans]
MEAQGTRRLPIHVSLTRPQLVAGGEKEWTQYNWLACIGAGVMLGQPWALGVMLVVASVVQYFLRISAKNDPQGLGILERHWKYQPFYPDAAVDGAKGYKSHEKQGLGAGIVALAFKPFTQGKKRGGK